jgi:hypothetical protein
MTIAKEEIFGPLVQPIDPNAPSGLTDKSQDSSAIFPEIYGPEFKLPPGMKDYEDSGDPPPYDYLPGGEFPPGPIAPSPYLNDFSKILNYN